MQDKKTDAAVSAQTQDPDGIKVNFRAIFEATRTPYLILLPDSKFTIIEVNEAYLHTTHTQRKAIIGRSRAKNGCFSDRY